MNIKFQQAAGLGDLLFLEPIARRLYLKGHKIFWPVIGPYRSIAQYIPYINWYDSSTIVYDSVYEFDSLKPAKYGCRILEAKYRYAGYALELWRGFHYNRYLNRELSLAEKLGINLDESYRLIHTEYDSNRLYAVPISESESIKNIYITPISGFSLFDWSSIIENAKEIHAVSTSSLYLFEKLELVHNPVINLYERHNDPHFEEVKFLFSKPYNLITHPGLTKGA